MAGVQERQWHGKNVGYGPGEGPMQMPPYMAPPHGGYHQGPYPGQRGGRSPYRGGGRRGGGPFRGGNGRGNFGHRPLRTDRSNPQFSGRARGRGGNRRIPQRVTTSRPETASTGEPASSVEHGDVEESAMVSASVPPSAFASRPPGKASSTRRQPQIAWCELCRVDCTSLDILEQHKNGKKHKKNLQRFEELQKAGNPLPLPMIVTNSSSAPGVVHNPTDIPASAFAPSAPTTPGSVPPIASSSFSEPTTTPMPDVQNEQPSLSESKSEVIAQAENVDRDETNNSEAPQDMSTEVPTDESKLESESKNDIVGQTEGEEGEPTETPGKKRRFDRLDSRKRGMNRKMRVGRGGKRMRTFDQPTWPVEPPKPKEVVPIICDLCNVKCDTQAVFETHLAGKKHISKLKRFEGHQAMFGPVGLQALYPPNPNTQPIFIPQVHQQNMYAPPSSFHQPVAYVPHAQHAATVSESQVIQNPEGDGAHVTWYGSQNEVDAASEGQEGQLAIGNIPENSVTRSEENFVYNPSEASVLPPQESTMTVSEHVAFAKDESITVADYRVTTTTTENVTFSGLDTKIAESTSRNEE
ncbi:hypothetical protein FRX31_021991 [Thalictrum thalictroides]|uniref:U1-type domain-containing protein n=1 Tax=Thalictrum thalictroides TaxID=46969 RepID=A0A7J6VUH3_THATH|nr:hypothetical protein FRX31_021991 [Thalictrum thalictroides]